MYDKMVKLIYAKTPNPTEDVERDHYFLEEAKAVIDFVKDDSETTDYIKRYIDNRQV